jgi:hydrogenase maturation protease
MASTLIIGYGNPLRSDDGLGWHVTEQLRRSTVNPEVKILTCHQLTPEIAFLLSRVELAIFIDAAGEGTPGTLCCEPVMPGAYELRFSHAMSPRAILGVSQRLYGAAPRAFMVSLCGESFELGDGLSAKIAARVHELISCIQSLLDQNLVRAEA